MKLFAYTRSKRNTAFVVLLVWLFALASSVANACFLEPEKPHSRAAIQAPAELVAPGTDAGHHDDSDGTKKSCLKVCDDTTHTLPKPYSGVDHHDPGPAPLVATLLAASLQVVSAPSRADDIPIGPPLRVRYSRLAL